MGLHTFVFVFCQADSIKHVDVCELHPFVRFYTHTCMAYANVISRQPV